MGHFATTLTQTTATTFCPPTGNSHQNSLRLSVIKWLFRGLKHFFFIVTINTGTNMPLSPELIRKFTNRDKDFVKSLIDNSLSVTERSKRKITTTSASHAYVCTWDHYAAGIYALAGFSICVSSLEYHNNISWLRTKVSLAWFSAIA